MQIIISNNSDKPIYEQITTQIKNMIISGELKPGDALPSMRFLAKELHISVITTKRAYEELERGGFIYSVVGKGSFVKSTNMELLKEEKLRLIEEYLSKAVDEAKKWVKIMQEEENIDVIVAVAHSGEEPKNPKNPGNRIQELAQEVDGIDAIVAGHTHQTFEQHNYKNSKGEEVIVTQPGKHGEAISKITFELKNQNGDWKVVNKYVKLTKFDTIKFDEYVGELLSKISGLKSTDKEIHLSEVVPFQWDKVYVFDENIDVDKIYETIGYKWQSIVLKDKHSEQQMVFMNDDKVVCYLYGDISDMDININFDKSSYKDGIIEIYPNKNDEFKVKKGEEEYQTYLTYISK